jgi:MoaA/NifB/PqqE/SkfB family radical SAM enzyme
VKTKTPKIVISFLMTRTNIEELPDLVNIVKDRGGNELVATNLDYTPITVLDELRAFSCNKERIRFKVIINRAIQKAKKMHLPFRVYPLEMEEVIMCEMNPLRIVFISNDGCISPCVYLNMTKRGFLQRIFFGSCSEVQRLCFGNVGEHDFMEIWQNGDYLNFRKMYAKRLSVSKDMYRDIVFDMASMEKLKATEKKVEESLMKNPVPEACKTCYKAYGI